MAVVYCHLDHCHDDDDDDEDEEEDKNDDKDDDDDFHYCDGKHNSLFKNIMFTNLMITDSMINIVLYMTNHIHKYVEKPYLQIWQ